MYKISRKDEILASSSGELGNEVFETIGPFVSDGCGNRFKSFSIIIS